MGRFALSDRFLRGAALAGAACGVAVFTATLFLFVFYWNSIPGDVKTNSELGTVPLGLTTPLVGLIVALRHRRNPIGWLLLVIGIASGLSVLTLVYPAIILNAHQQPQTLALWVLWVNGWIWTLALLPPLTILFLLFPDGHLLSRRWRVVAWLSGLVIGTSVVIGMAYNRLGIGNSPSIYPSPFPLTLPIIDPRTGGPSTFGATVYPILFATYLLVFVGSGASQVLRWRRASGEQRQQTKLMLYAMALFLGTGAASFGYAVVVSVNNSNPWLDALNTLSANVVVIALGVAILRYRLYDVDLLVNRALVYGGLAAFITAIYVLLVIGVGAVIGNTTRSNLVLSLVATAIVAVAFQPVRQRAQHLANRLVYGKRATPYEVLSRFSSNLGETFSSDDILETMSRVLADGTGATRAEVWIRTETELTRAAAWPPVSEVESVPMADGSLPPLAATRVAAVTHQGELLGALAVTKPRDGMTPIEEHMLRDLAAQAGLVLKNLGLNRELLARLRELQASRRRLVTAQDEERRRLERNLHDGAQQQLVALKVQLGLVEALVGSEHRARPVLEQLKRDADEALSNLRDLARGIYPPLLASDGLRAALENQVRRSPVPVDLSVAKVERQAPDVEAAIYFCCLEALQNVSKYAHASRAAVRIWQEDGVIRLSVSDDGAGFDAASVRSNSGLQNMRDRLSALGGHLDIRSIPGSGTEVRGEVPQRAPEPRPDAALAPA